jgi:hypothetical protein
MTSLQDRQVVCARVCLCCVAEGERWHAFAMHVVSVSCAINTEMDIVVRVCECEGRADATVASRARCDVVKDSTTVTVAPCWQRWGEFVESPQDDTPTSVDIRYDCLGAGV